MNKKLYFLLFSIITLSVYPIFLGSNFFAEEDIITLFYHTNGNVFGNGWRSDKGLGTSHFFGDPGAFHAWSILTILNKILNLSDFNFYNFSIIILIFLGCASIANFLKKIHSNNITILIIFLSLLIFWSPMRYELIFQRHWIASIFSLPILIYYTKLFFEKKSKICFFFVTISFSFSLYLGSIAALQNILFTSFIFLIVHCFHTKNFLTNLKNYIYLYLLSLIVTFLIGFWIWYPIFIEYFLVGYERSYTEYLNLEDFGFRFNIYNLGKFIFGLFNSGVFPSSISLPDKGLLPLSSWFNVNPLFPIVFIFYLFYKPKVYWEIISKNIIIIFFVHYFLVTFLVGYKNIPIYFFKLYSWHKFFLDLYFFQIILISFFVLRIKDFRENKKIFFVISKNLIGSIIIFIHFSLLIFCFLSLIDYFPLISLVTDKFSNLLVSLKILEPIIIENYSYVLKETLKLLFDSVSYSLFIFYLITTAFIMMLFLKRNYFIKQKLFLLIILVNSYFLGSGVYPLVEKNLIWEGNNSSFNSKLPERSAYIDLSIHQIHLAKTLKEKLDIWTNNSKTYKQVGYLSPPGNSFSSILSHWSRDSSNFLKENLKNNGFENLREISNGKSSILDNQKLINFLNIKYIYFKNRPNKSLLNNRYKLLNENNGIYLYENLDHFPYFYFGDRVVKNKSFNINDLIKGDIIVNNEIIFENLKKINFKSNEKKIDLIEWKNGSFTFDYVSKINNVFIVHDLWHPNWKVKIQDLKFGNTKVKDEIFIFQANHIFKGLFLPKGNYRFELYYDTKNYNLGLYISGILIIMFVVVFLRIKKNEQY